MSTYLIGMLEMENKLYEDGMTENTSRRWVCFLFGLFGVGACYVGALPESRKYESKSRNHAPENMENEPELRNFVPESMENTPEPRNHAPENM